MQSHRRDWPRTLAGTNSVVEGLAAACVIVLETGLARGAAWTTDVRSVADALVLATFSLRLLSRGIKNWRSLKNPRGVLTPLLALALGLLASPRIAAGVVLLHDAYELLLWQRRTRPAGRVLHSVGVHPARSLVVSFLALIGGGAVLLWLPASSAGEPVHLIDALFTATSATCVTGLATLDTATAWSPFGKGVILVLFQLGALGIMVISAAMTLAFGQSLGARRGAALGDVFDEANAEQLRKLITTVVAGTALVESIGAALLFIRFVGHMPLADAALEAVFHAVSAFCNAGFALHSDSLVSYAGDVWVNVVIMLLITLGGLGFGVLVGLATYVGKRGRSFLTVHTKIVLVTSLVLLWLGAMSYFFFEYDRSLARLGIGEKMLAALFQSVTARTAGFNTVPLENLHPATILVMIILMFVGASPGSTGGGVKTTTFALVFLAARAFLFERESVTAFGRSIGQQQILRAFALMGGAALSFSLGFGALLVSDDLPFEWLAFETGSALGTVGLTLGATPQLSATGRLVVIALMFIGRVGPLTAVAAAASQVPRSSGVTLPEGKVLIG